ncbi:MAG: class C sortase, partial [Eubacterium sp.]|nr:class C sortase [Eubacterium sp.]
MKQRGTTILLLVVLLVGLSLLAYPKFSNWWNSLHQSRVIMSYTDSVSNLNREEYDRILGDAWRYNKAWVENGIS